MNVWRLHTNTAGGYIGDYCFAKNVAAIGWCLRHYKSDIQSGKKTVKHFVDFEKFAIKSQGKDASSRGISQVKKLSCEIKANDLIWMRHAGIYYIGRVEGNSIYDYDFSDTAYNKDACNQLTNIFWQKVGDEDAVAGAISSAFNGRGRTLQKINSITPEYSKFVYDKVSGKNIYNVVNLGSGKTLEEKRNIFFNLLHYYDLEDLVCMYLYFHNQFVAIPSTNKTSTPLYECVLLDTKTGKNIYIQTKMNSDIDANNYKNLSKSGDVYLCSALKSVQNLQKVSSNIQKILPEGLYDFATAKRLKNFIPKRISDYVDLIG